MPMELAPRNLHVKGIVGFYKALTNAFGGERATRQLPRNAIEISQVAKSENGKASGLRDARQERYAPDRTGECRPSAVSSRVTTIPVSSLYCYSRSILQPFNRYGRGGTAFEGGLTNLLSSIGTLS